MIVVLTGAHAALATDDTLKYLPFSAYSIKREAEMAQGRSAAPDQISGRATVEIHRHCRRAEPPDAVTVTLSGGATTIVCTGICMEKFTFLSVR